MSFGTAPNGAEVEMSFLKAMHDALRAEMELDETVFVLGEDVREGTFGLTAGLVDEFGEHRVRDTPISEGAIVGAAVGAAMCGRRPFADMNISTFSYVAMDQLINQAAKNRFLFGGQTQVPAVFHFVQFHRSNAAAQHTDRPHPLFMGIPGFKVVAPSTPRDAKGLLTTALRDNDPVIFFTDMTLWARKGMVPETEYEVPIGEAHVAREGSDVTLVSFFMLRDALAAADELAAEGIDVEVIDPRTLSPLDHDTILASVAKTGRIVIGDIAHPVCSAASEVAAVVAEHSFGSLKGPVQRVCAPNLHVPYSPHIERDFFPGADDLVKAVQKALEA